MRNRYLLLSDVPIVAMAAHAAFALRFDWLFPRPRPEFIPFLIAALLLKPTVFVLLGMYSRLWRYASVWDLSAVFVAVTVSSVAASVVVAAGALSEEFDEFSCSRAVLVIEWLVTLCGTGGIRMAVR